MDGPGRCTAISMALSLNKKVVGGTTSFEAAVATGDLVVAFVIELLLAD